MLDIMISILVMEVLKELIYHNVLIINYQKIG